MLYIWLRCIVCRAPADMTQLHSATLWGVPSIGGCDTTTRRFSCEQCKKREQLGHTHLFLSLFALGFFGKTYLILPNSVPFVNSRLLSAHSDYKFGPLGGPHLQPAPVVTGSGSAARVRAGRGGGSLPADAASNMLLDR